MHSKQSVFIYKDELTTVRAEPVSQGAALEPQWGDPLDPLSHRTKKRGTSGR